MNILSGWTIYLSFILSAACGWIYCKLMNKLFRLYVLQKWMALRWSVKDLSKYTCMWMQHQRLRTVSIGACILSNIAKFAHKFIVKYVDIALYFLSDSDSSPIIQRERFIQHRFNLSPVKKEFSVKIEYADDSNKMPRLMSSFYILVLLDLTFFPSFCFTLLSFTWRTFSDILCMVKKFCNSSHTALLHIL